MIRREFYDEGYVPGFTNATFATFTFDSVGVSIQDAYGLSKGASLMRFFDDADDCACAKLLCDLVKHREDMQLFGEEEIGEAERALLDECLAISERLSSSGSLVAQESMVRGSTFNTAYIDQQVSQMFMSIESNPSDAIGKSKDLLEACAKTVLKERGVDYSGKPDFGQLMKLALQALNLTRDSVPDDKKASETIKRILSSVSQIVGGVNDLRNSYGTGHGKENDYEGLSRRHARLVVGLSSSIVTFLWDTHEAMPRK